MKDNKNMNRRSKMPGSNVENPGLLLEAALPIYYEDIPFSSLTGNHLHFYQRTCQRTGNHVYKNPH